MKASWWFLFGASLQAWATDVTPAATQLNNRGSQFFAAHAYTQAEECFLSARDLLRQTGASETVEGSTVLFNLAAVYREQMRLDAAEPLYWEALTIREKLSGPDDPSLAGPLKGLTLLYLSKGTLPRAEEAGRRALAIRERAPAARAVLAEAKNVLALVLLTGHREQEAEAQVQEVIASLPGALPAAGRLQAATAITLLGRVRLTQGRYREAAEQFRHALPLLAGADGTQTVAEAACNLNLGLAEAGMGAWREGVQRIAAATRRYEELHGPNHPSVAFGLTGMADILAEHGKVKDAEPLYRRALAIQHGAFGPESVNTAAALNNLGSLACRRHRWAEAEPLLTRALDIYRVRLGEESVEAGLVAANLALVYEATKRMPEAEAMFAKASAIRGRERGDTDPMLGNLLGHYANALRQNQRYSEAEQAEVRAMRTRVRLAVRDANSSGRLALTD